MKSFFNLASVLATVVVLTVADESCERDDVLESDSVATPVLVSDAVVAVTDTTTASAASTTANATTNVFAPVVNPALDRHDISHVIPHYNVSLYYASNTTIDSSMKINHTMVYPTVVLEQIAYISNVDCTKSSVAVTFNDSSVFEATQAAWLAEGTFVMITNHLGDCDPELERSFFLAEHVTYDNKTLIATALSSKTNVSNTAEYTEITFGKIPTGTVNKRGFTTTIDPSYNIDQTFTIAEDYTIFAIDPYLTVSTVDSATFTGNVTFSGYLKYNWLLWKLEDLYFDIDAGLSADLTLSADIKAQYNTTFSYSPAVLYYGFSVPGILELGPELQFGVDALVGASAEVKVTTELTAEILDGNIHVDLLDESLTTTSGWVPTYTAKVNVSGEVQAEINPAVVLTVEVAINFFSGLLDLSTGLTASAGFDNSLTLTAAAGIDLSGVENLSKNGTCSEGLALKSEFVFDVVAFVTSFYKTTLYSVDIPLYNQCFSWE